MKRILVALVLALVIATALVAALPFLISSDLVKERLLSGARELTGREVTFRGNPSVSFNPFLGVEILDVAIADADDPSKSLVSMEKMQAQLEVLPALIGQAEITNFRFFRPHFTLTVNTSGISNWVFDKGQFRRHLDQLSAQAGQTDDTAPPPALPPLALGRFEIIDGNVTYSDEISGIDHAITNLNGTVNWPTAQSRFQSDLKGVWRGEQVALNLNAANMMHLLSGKKTDLDFKLQSAPVEASFNGQANIIADLHLAGALSINSPSFNRFAEFLDYSLLDGLFFGEFSASGMVDATPKGASLTGASVSIGGNQSSGLLQWSLGEDEVPKVNGTLAFDSVSLNNFLQAVTQQRSIAASGQTDLPENTPLELDLRLSANTVQMGEITATEFAATLSSAKGVWFLDVGNASLFSGSLIAKLETDFNDLSPKFKLNASASGLDLATLFNALGADTTALSGSMKLKLEAITSGETHYELAKNTNGKVELNVSPATITNLDFARVYEALNQKEFRLTPDDVSGTTTLEELAIEFSIFDGIAWTTDNHLQSNGHKLTLIGNADLYLGGLALRGDLEPLAAQDQTAEEVKRSKRSLFIGGTLMAPLLTRWKLDGRLDSQL